MLKSKEASIGDPDPQLRRPPDTVGWSRPKFVIKGDDVVEWAISTILKLFPLATSFICVVRWKASLGIGLPVGEVFDVGLFFQVDLLAGFLAMHHGREPFRPVGAGSQPSEALFRGTRCGTENDQWIGSNSG